MRRTLSLSRVFQPMSIQRLRVRLARSGAGALLTHLHQIDMIRQALRASGWPVVKSQNRRPKFKVAFGPAIAVGYESEAEYFDVDLESRLDVTQARDMLIPHLAPGYALLSVKSIPRFFPSLEESLNAVAYEVGSPLLVGTQDRWEAFWKKDHLMVIKKKESGDTVVDARAVVRRWILQEDRLDLEMRFGPGRTLKPEAVIQAVCGFEESQMKLESGASNFLIKRKALLFEKATGELVEP